MWRSNSYIYAKSYLVVSGITSFNTINMCDRGCTITHMQIPRFHTQVWYKYQESTRWKVCPTFLVHFIHAPSQCLNKTDLQRFSWLLWGNIYWKEYPSIYVATICVLTHFSLAITWNIDHWNKGQRHSSHLWSIIHVAIFMYIDFRHLISLVVVSNCSPVAGHFYSNPFCK